MQFSYFYKMLQSVGLEHFQRFYGSYRGFVADNEDPEFLGRLKLRVPQIYGDKVREYWAWPKGMFAGNQIGMFAIPNVGDGVWVSFENGDSRFPIWEYGWFARGEVPNSAKVDGNKPKNMVWQSTSGHRIEMDDKNERINIQNKAGQSILIENDAITIEALDKIVTINAMHSSIELNNEGISINSPQGVSINGGFEALYNMIPGAPIADVSQIGVSKKVKIG